MKKKQVVLKGQDTKIMGGHFLSKFENHVGPSIELDEEGLTCARGPKLV